MYMAKPYPSVDTGGGGVTFYFVNISAQRLNLIKFVVLTKSNSNYSDNIRRVSNKTREKNLQQHDRMLYIAMYSVQSVLVHIIRARLIPCSSSNVTTRSPRINQTQPINQSHPPPCAAEPLRMSVSGWNKAEDMTG